MMLSHSLHTDGYTPQQLRPVGYGNYILTTFSQTIVSGFQLTPAQRA